MDRILTKPAHLHYPQKYIPQSQVLAIQVDFDEKLSMSINLSNTKGFHNETFYVSAAPSLEMKLKGNTPNFTMEIKLSNLV